jgi:integrase
VQSKRAILKHHLLPAFGGKKLDVIQQREIEGYKSIKLKAGLAPKTVNNHLTILRRILSLAAEWGVLTHTPPVKWLKVPEPEFDFLDFDEAARLEKGAMGEWAAMFTVGLTTGLRQGELLALRWEDVDLARGRLLVCRAASSSSATTQGGCYARAPASGLCGARAGRSVNSRAPVSRALRALPAVVGRQPPEVHCRAPPACRQTV